MGRKRESWGTVYSGSGDWETAARAIETAASGAGMRCRRSRPAEGLLEIDCRQQSHPLRVIALSLPQRSLWRIEHSPGQLRLCLSRRFFAWYAALVVFLCLLMGAALISAAQGMRQDWPIEDLGGLVFLFAVLAFLNAYLLEATGGQHTEAILQDVLAQVEKRGGLLQPEGMGGGWRHIRRMLAYLGFFLSLVAVAAVLAGARPADFFFAARWPLVGAAMAVVMGFLMLMGLFIASVRGFGFRTMPVIAGLGSMVSMFFLLCMPLPWLAAGNGMDMDQFGSGLHVAVSLLEEAAVSGSSIGPLSAARYLAEMRTLAWMLMAANLLIGSFAALFFVRYCVYQSLHSWPAVRRLHSYRGVGIYREAAGGRIPVGAFRFAFLLFWLLFSGLLLTAACLVLLCSLQALFPVFTASELRLVELSVQLCALAFGRPLDDPLVTVSVRLAWVLYGILVAGLLTLSVGTLWRKRRKSRQKLRAQSREEASSLCRRRLVPVLERLKENGRIPYFQVRLAIDPSRPSGADSLCFGLLGRERYIRISAKAAERWKVEDCEAVLAHELAHHLLGHCRRDVWLRWLGRLTFTGDGFVQGVRDSFWEEFDADEKAALRLGADKEALKRCLTEGKPEANPPEPFFDPGGPSEWKRIKRWRYAWQIFLEQYSGCSKYHYWHPEAEERRRALDRS